MSSSSSIMFASVAVIRLVVLVFLVVLGVFGNAGVPVLVHRAHLRSRHVTLLAALDFAATFIGPGVMLLSTVLGPRWLERNMPHCPSLAFLGTFTQTSCFVGLFCFALFCRKRRVALSHEAQRKVNKRHSLFSLAVAMATGLVLGIAPFLGWSSFSGLPWSCSPPFHGEAHVRISSYSLAYHLSSFLVLIATAVLSMRGVRRRRLYPLQRFWERHLLEMESNDPEVTTTDSSNTTSNTLRSMTCCQVSGSRSSGASASNTPMNPRKFSILPGVAGVTMSDTVGQIPRQRALLSYPGNQRDPGARPKETAQALRLQFNSGSYRFGLSREPFVVRSKKNLFRSPKLLPSFTLFQKQRFWSRFVVLRSCLSLACWTPLWTTALLQFFCRCCPNESHLVAQWLTYLPSSISPLLLMCGVGYRRACRRTACSILHTCSRRKRERVDLIVTRERTEQVRLNYVTPLDSQKL